MHHKISVKIVSSDTTQFSVGLILFKNTLEFASAFTSLEWIMKLFHLMAHTANEPQRTVTSLYSGGRSFALWLQPLSIRLNNYSVPFWDCLPFLFNWNVFLFVSLILVFASSVWQLQDKIQLLTMQTEHQRCLLHFFPKLCISLRHIFVRTIHLDWWKLSRLRENIPPWGKTFHYIGRLVWCEALHSLFVNINIGHVWRAPKRLESVLHF